MIVLLFKLNIVHEFMKKSQSKLRYVEVNDIIVASMELLGCSYDGKIYRFPVS